MRSGGRVRRMPALVVHSGVSEAVTGGIELTWGSSELGVESVVFRDAAATA